LGVNLTPIIVKQITNLEALSGKSLAVDAHNVLHQFLALIRTPNGTPLSDPEGEITSHLVGLVFRTTRLIAEHRMKLVFVFDGKPPQLKKKELEKRRAQKKEAEEEYVKAVAKGDLVTAYSKSVQIGRLTNSMIEDAKRLLDLLGVPWIQAPSEGEAQAAYLAQNGDVWGTNSRDYDSLLLGTPRLIRYLTIQGQEWLPSKRIARKLKPEIIELNKFLKFHNISREQLVDIAILIGTDFNEGIKGIGPKTALKLVKEYEDLEGMPDTVAYKIPLEYQEIRKIFMEPNVTKNYSISSDDLDRNGLIKFLCGEKGFSRNRVETVIQRIERSKKQKSLSDWLGGK
jgi:flap endonuclease-1